MKRIISSIVISALTVVGGAVVGGTPAYAAATPTLVLSGGSAVLGLDPATITATASAPGTVQFSAAGALIPGCDAVATTTETPFVAKCSWRPTASGATILTATLSPNDAANFSAATATPFTVKVGVPVQGVISPVYLYVDTVLASGSSGVLAARFGVSCAVTSQFIVGQTIVFRIYANNADLGGAAMDTTNTEKAYIEVAGVANPIPLSYGNHSGVAFWTGVLKTGTATGLYNTLGIISYKVTIVGKELNTTKVLAVKSVPKVVKGKVVKKNGKTVYVSVPYIKTVSANPPVKGPVGTWQSNFTPNSQLTLYAVPTA